jgi:hypothetical protein
LSRWQPRQLAVIYVQTDSVSEALFDLNPFTRLSAREHFIERQTYQITASYNNCHTI